LPYVSHTIFPLTLASRVSVATLPLAASLSWLPWLVFSLVLAWVNMKWADWVASRSDLGELDRDRFRPSCMAVLKYFAVVFLVFGLIQALSLIFIVSLETTHKILNSLGQAILPSVGNGLTVDEAGREAPLVLLAGLWLVVLLLGLWMTVRLSLLPARAAIGESSSIAACWQSTRGFFWSLFGLLFCILGIVVFAVMLSWAVAAMIAFGAAAAGWIAPPAMANFPGIAHWLASPQLQPVALVSSVLIAPVTGTVFFIFTGSIIHAALLLRRARRGGTDALAFALAAWQAEHGGNPWG